MQLEEVTTQKEIISSDFNLIFFVMTYFKNKNNCTIDSSNPKMDSSNHVGGSIRTVLLRQLHVYCKIKQFVLMYLKTGIFDKEENTNVTLVRQETPWEFPEDSVVKTLCLHCKAQVRFLVGQLRSICSAVQSKRKRNILQSCLKVSFELMTQLFLRTGVFPNSFY